MSEHRAWREQLNAIWPEWDAALDTARRSGLAFPKELPFPKPSRDRQVTQKNSHALKEEVDHKNWIAVPECWVHMARGMGDYPRFALMRYLQLPDGAQAFDPHKVERLITKEWVCFVEEAVDDATFLPRNKQGEFDSQACGPPYTSEDPVPEKRAKRLKPLFDDPRLWSALAHAANTYLFLQGRSGSTPISSEVLRNGYFGGPTAIIDFITYINTGIIPARQAPFPDELFDLRVIRPSDKLDSSDEPKRPLEFFESKKRLEVIDQLARHLSDPEVDAVKTGGVCGISSLWSSLQPHGLIATCGEVVKKYRELCENGELRRLQIIYAPVGLDSTQRYVSRREVVRDLYAKLRIARARARGEHEIPRRLAENPTGEAVDRAIAEIRIELAMHPALIIFGIHQVTPSSPVAAVIEEVLDAPLHFFIDRVMSETGVFGNLTPPHNAYATRYLILADGELTRIANMHVAAFKLPPCPAERFQALCEWNHFSRVQTLSQKLSLANIASNEVELQVLESVVAFANRSVEADSGDRLVQRAIQLIWGSTLEPSKQRTAPLVSALVEHVVEQAQIESESDTTASFSILLHLVSLIPGGIRLFTAARVLAGYMTATTRVTSPDAAARVANTRALENKIFGHLKEFETLATGLVRSFPAAAAAGFDEYAHPFESPEVPAFQFNFADNKLQFEFVSPFVRRIVCQEFKRLQPQKHALLHRAIAEEFIRRAAIVQCHCQEKDVRSLVDKRYLVIALHSALQSLAVDTNRLLTAEGQGRLRWRIPARSRVRAYHWIYRCLYVEQLNSNEQALSQEHGAEFLKRALLEDFLESDPQRPQGSDKGFLSHLDSRNALEHFGIRCELLHGLIYVSGRISDVKLAADAFRRLDELVGLVATQLDACGPKLSDEHKLMWQRALRTVERDTAKLRLDAAVSYGAAFSVGESNHTVSGWKAVYNNTLRALVDSDSAHPLEPPKILAVIKDAVAINKKKDPPQWRFTREIDPLRQLIREDDAIRHFYSYLCRFAELLAGTAESRPNDERRAQRRTRALMLFELAEALRVRYASGPLRETALKVSSRSLRNAARVCLSLGRYSGEDWYYERAAHYCFHVTGNKPQRIERIAVLITQAITIRFRASSAEQLRLAMHYLKTAERALINYPDRIQLWMRFYLERAKLFRAWAFEPTIGTREASWCVAYCHADVAALKRLADYRQAWVKRGDRVLKNLPQSPADPRLPQPGTLNTSAHKSAAGTSAGKAQAPTSSGQRRNAAWAGGPK